MSPFPLSSLISRPLCGAVTKARPPRPNARYFVPSAGKTYARFQHADAAKRAQIEKEFRKDFKKDISKFWLKIGTVTVGLGVAFLAAPVIYCDPVISKTAPGVVSSPSQDNTVPTQPSPPLPPPPQSSLKIYELTFGTVCGICAGVFVKKGAKAVAFVMGGVFVLLQYLGSLSLVRVDWGRAATRFENLFYSTDATGAKRPPNVASLFRWIVDFLTADFQQRATFVAGFALGLRIG
ncbi:FUN14 family-domain-containing protein [Trametes maxima]|nr:FUN14 family-domain-containing protein [Trametes maxima]